MNHSGRVCGVPTEQTTRRVALFATCLTDTFFPDTARAVVRLLERLGCSVEFPEAQTCCGQMHFNTGYRTKAAPLARNVATVFAGYDAVVVPSGSCAGMVRHVYPELNVTPSPTYELSEFLIDVLGVEDVGAYFPHRVTYHPTCHSLRMLGVGDKPLRLLRAVKGLDLVELPAADSCCGFGGTFALKNADVSSAMLADKMSCVLDTGAEVVSAGDNSCLMHIGGGLSRLQAGVHPVHLAEILASTEEEPWVATP
ncbi:(Fe-S)-binding protein [Kibdelosporangium aridum]|uniref:(Fe-S)-binding protein n=1 Tax=Kibdelosporangium aridum TaxID=2030 RepID=A0A428YM70_KIBAR|nr:(Fe-S)-binding protein [Kibdelosporangium aridum]